MASFSEIAYEEAVEAFDIFEVWEAVCVHAKKDWVYAGNVPYGSSGYYDRYTDIMPEIEKVTPEIKLLKIIRILIFRPFSGEIGVGFIRDGRGRLFLLHQDEIQSNFRLVSLKTRANKANSEGWAIGRYL